MAMNGLELILERLIEHHRNTRDTYAEAKLKGLTFTVDGGHTIEEAIAREDRVVKSLQKTLDGMRNG